MPSARSFIASSLDENRRNTLPRGVRWVVAMCTVLAGLAAHAAPLVGNELAVGDFNLEFDGGQQSPFAGYLAGRFIVGWAEQTRDAGLDVRAVFIDDAGSISPAFRLRLPGDQDFPSIACGIDQCMVGWQDLRSGNYDVYLSVLTPTGLLASDGGVLVCDAPGQQSGVHLGATSTAYLVAWEDQRSGGFDVYAAWVAKDGTVLTPNGAALHTEPDRQANAQVGCGEQSCSVTWEDNAGLGSPNVMVAGLPVLAEPSDAGRLLLTATANGMPEPVVACELAGRCMVAYSDRVVAATGSDIFGAWFDPAGFIDAGLTFTDAGGPQVRPAAAFDGARPLVAWLDGSTGIADGVMLGLGPRNELAVGRSLGAGDPPAVATDQHGAILVAYVQRSSGAPDRVRARFVVDRPLGASCATSVECQTQQCADGLCCDTPCGGSSSTDCQACSVAAGGLSDGLCAPIGAARVCRASAGVCDVTEMCDGLAALCPADGVALDGADCTIGSCSAGVCLAEPSRFGTDAPGPATCGVPWSWAPRLDGHPPLQLGIMSAPARLQLDAGTLTWLPPDAGTFALSLTASGPGGAGTRELSLEVACAGPPPQPPRALGVRCGCTAGAPVELAGLLLALNVAAKLIRRSPCPRPTAKTSRSCSPSSSPSTRRRR